jgi:hypothetical protein
MAKGRQGRVVWTAAGVVALVGIGLYINWRFFEPKLNRASQSKVDAVLPRELLVETPIDKAAQARFETLAKLLHSIDPKKVETMYGRDPDKPVTGGPTPAPRFVPPAKREASVRLFLASAGGTYSKIDALLKSGPLQIDRKWKLQTHFYTDHIAELKGFVRTALHCAYYVGEAGDEKECLSLIRLALDLTRRCMAANNTVLDYLVEASLDAMVMTSIQEIVDLPGFTMDDCRSLLLELEAAPRIDTCLVNALRTDFQLYTWRQLAQDPVGTYRELYAEASVPSEDDGDTPAKANDSQTPVAGTFDALETARLSGAQRLQMMRNAARPFANYDNSMDAEVERQAKGLPEPSSGTLQSPIRTWWDRIAFRMQMNNTHNSMGRTILAAQGSFRSAISLSCRWRAQRDATRVLLASRLYRAGHGGALPPTPAGFLPLMGEWPQDPFNGKPMIYSPSKEKVYSVGANLVDDGGDFDQRGFVLKDVGVALKLPQR